ncbi:energy-coupling factor transporter transmembrane component T family protein [Vallicoccus soli]|uniref:Energy-coupling factor transporter transmembrane protein EcfT n=1 Tax=Vallicoccus soli TaxID=2339232 RepID=A0A3A3Z1B2_9ACTN|nr:energy-coupling factor transporter transmembrane component T [Vallicoccus soli]RJK98040.1 energy-coupling factor transporter transmembrane protein EcfT [Vallicoccus soli]
MSLLAPLATDPSAPLARRGPLAKLGAALVVMAVLLVTVDPLTPAVLLAAELLALPFAGVPPRALLRRGWPLLIAALSLALANALLTDVGTGRVLLDAGPLHLTADGLAVGLTAGLRVLAVALPGVVAFATIDPVDLADALAQQLRLPPRPVYGALAAWRLVLLLAEDRRSLARARRARGVDARGPVAAVRLGTGTLLGLLVAAVRRATRLATAMDARGFDSGLARTYARRQVLDRGDVALLAGATALALGATALSVAVGVWEPLLS